MGRHVAVRVLVGLASLALALALVTAYVQRAVIDSDAFANRATQALQDDSVRSLVAREVTDQVVLKFESDLIAARPVIESVASEVVGGGAFRGLFRRAVRRLHRALLRGDARRLSLTVTDIGTVLAAGLDVIKPRLGDQVRRAGQISLLTRDIGYAGVKAASIGDAVSVLSPLLLGLSLLLGFAAIRLSEDRRATTVHLGVGVAAGAVLLLVAQGLARSAIVDGIEAVEDRAAAGAVWDAFLGDLRTAAWILAAVGAVVAASAASLIRPFEIGEPLQALAARARALPPTRTVRAVRGLSLVGLGLWILLARDTVLAIALDLAGVYVIYEGVTALLWLIYEPPARRRRRHPDKGKPARVVAEDRRPVIAALLVAAMATAGAVAFARSGAAPRVPPVVNACNGHAELCDRSLDHVALAATHNSMSVPLPGWYAAEQEAPIAEQLKDGIRGLLIDTHYADRLSNGRLRTDLDQGKVAQAVEDGSISQATVDAALRLRGQVGYSGRGKRGIYLCHTFCELGGTPLDLVLADLRDFLDANPGEVVVVIVEDYVAPGDFVAAVRRARLDELAFTPPAEGRWPTLREMIDRRQRVLFLAENNAGGAPWLKSAYGALTQETPYAFKQVAQLTDPARLPASCAPNRGSGTAPLLLVNHWITTDPLPLPSNAVKVNARAPLLERLRTCQRIRNQLPNLVAVNFYREGDLLGVIDELNGVG